MSTVLPEGKGQIIFWGMGGLALLDLVRISSPLAEQYFFLLWLNQDFCPLAEPEIYRFHSQNIFS